ncbi:uncharacterized protein LOC134817055 [Bolinopsis microptera]|uniref:uncharacterized protein LOC134817055 n=1 Tax=Bolinopsis microptera TaxID=2820187 RepID=UPI00307A9481
MVCERVSNKSPPPISKAYLETALDSELISERALREVILDDGQTDKIMQFLSCPRRRRSSVCADHLLIKQIGPSLGSKLLEDTLREINKVVQLKTFTEQPEIQSPQSCSEQVKGWFATPNKVVSSPPDQLHGKRTTLGLGGYKLTTSRSLFLTIVAKERFKAAHPTRQNKTASKKVVHGSRVNTQSSEEEGFTEIPPLDKVQEHIERVRTIMGQSPVTPSGRQDLFSSRGRREPEPKAKLTAHMVYKVPFPALKRRRDTHLAGEKYIHSLILDD